MLAPAPTARPRRARAPAAPKSRAPETKARTTSTARRRRRRGSAPERGQDGGKGDSGGPPKPFSGRFFDGRQHARHGATRRAARASPAKSGGRERQGAERQRTGTAAPEERIPLCPLWGQATRRTRPPTQERGRAQAAHERSERIDEHPKLHANAEAPSQRGAGASAAARPAQRSKPGGSRAADPRPPVAGDRLASSQKWDAQSGSRRRGRAPYLRRLSLYLIEGHYSVSGAHCGRVSRRKKTRCIKARKLGQSCTMP